MFTPGHSKGHEDMSDARFQDSTCQIQEQHPWFVGETHTIVQIDLDQSAKILCQMFVTWVN